MALGRVGPARRAIAASSAREGEKARNMETWTHFRDKSRKKLIVDVFFVVDHDHDLKNKIGVFPAVFEKLRLLIFH